MAYIRGDHYIWSDGERLHVWMFDGADGWEESGWATDLDGRRGANRATASGTSIPQSVMDEYVMMRVVELVDEGLIGGTIQRALRHGNFGGQSLAKRAESIVNALARL